MALEQITGENLSEVMGFPKFARFDPDTTLKFVLERSPNGRGYIRVDGGPEHIDTLGRLNDYLVAQGDSPQTFVTCGGGLVDVHNQDKTKRTKLIFYSQSSVLGSFDRDLLQQTLEEALDKEKFEYQISEAPK
jgi:hypothetical protein